MSKTILEDEVKVVVDSTECGVNVTVGEVSEALTFTCCVCKKLYVVEDKIPRGSRSKCIYCLDESLCSVGVDNVLPLKQYKQRGVTAGQVYKHFKGNTYVVTGISVDTETMERMVNYQEVDVGEEGDFTNLFGTIWSRSEKVFQERLYGTPGHHNKRRFRLLGRIT